jgi:inorganic pyrophosphatase
MFSTSSKVWIDKKSELSYISRNVENADDRIRHFLHHKEAVMSPWHDIPLKPENSETDIYNSIMEITRGTTEKMEVETTMEHNPIVQD